MRPTARILILLYFAACASTPSIQLPVIGVDTPSDWSATDPVVSDSVRMAPHDDLDTDGEADQSGLAWWHDLGDSTLGRVIEEGLQNNLDLTAAAHRMDMVLAQARIAGAAAAPQVALGADVGRARRNFIGFPIGGGDGGVAASTTTSFAANLLVSWEIDLWGRLRASQAAALADVGAAQSDLTAAHLSLSAQIAHLYFAVIEARHQLELARSTAASQQQSAEQIEERYDRGLRTSLDLRLARSSAASARAAVAVRRIQFDATTRQLEALLGRYPAASLTVTQDLPRLDGHVPVGLPADLVSRRPDLAAGERRLVAAHLRTKQARRALLPRISLTASSGRSSDALGDLLDGDYSVWNLVTNLSQPLFQGGRLRAQVGLAESSAAAAHADYVSLALRAFSEVEAALVRASALADQESALQIAADEARAAEQLADERYARGLANYIALLESQRRAFEAQSQLLSVRRQRLDARIDLYVALGGGFALASSSSSI